MQNLKDSLVDGKTIVNKDLLSKIIDKIISLETSESSGGLSYCNFHHNLGAIGEFITKYKLKEVDDFNQLTICMAGDSIFGRQDKGTTWVEASPEISYTPDMNDVTETRYGYQTGHFPPNMWEQTVPFKTLKLLQWNSADVKYFSHNSVEISKNGAWVDGFPALPDSIRGIYSTTVGDYVIFSFENATHIKAIFPSYSTLMSKNACFEISFSTDNGSTWKSPEELGIISSMPNENGNYQMSSVGYKWGNVCFKGFDKSLAYKVKITNKSTTNLSFWGFETWSKPRINVVVTACGGNTAYAQKNAPERFYSEMYNPSLVIYELPFLNDLGAAATKNFKSKITPTSSAPTSPTDLDFYYCEEDGVYINFGNIEAKQGEYIEYKNSQWVLGTTKLTQLLKTYKTDNEIVFERIAQQGVPTLALITHASTNDQSRPFCSEIAIPSLRGMVGKYGFAVLDVNNYQRIAGYYTTQNRVIHSDGTHLNDKGVEMYMDLISLLFTIPLNEQYAGSASVVYKPLFGTGTGGTTVNFGFEFSKVPNILVSGGTDIVVTSVTKSGFTTTGSGEFKYIAQII